MTSSLSDPTKASASCRYKASFLPAWMFRMFRMFPKSRIHMTEIAGQERSQWDQSGGGIKGRSIELQQKRTRTIPRIPETNPITSSSPASISTSFLPTASSPHYDPRGHSHPLPIRFPSLGEALLCPSFPLWSLAWLRLFGAA
jgi:hypothetical protein